ncbi:uncharacterized protein si:dkey-112e17.1 isoform X1 [Polypterus senegalus]|uniref:uncharacterized protein si:dkey-112e17.1 isoform X1 n=2 Tax=Polypterus senegalus TaxID=55291 RepID=UPI0019669513|nr:uncharacterized protein si:dkey-112e17.1 isoform X1 [Polypterus senegalus]
MEKTAWACVLMTAALLCLPGAAPHKVYYSCGAVVDVTNAEERGLVLSPGFPYSYFPGTHCVWRFFVPAGYRLIMEVLEFDVFENQSKEIPSPGRRRSKDATGGRTLSPVDFNNTGSRVEVNVYEAYSLTTITQNERRSSLSKAESDKADNSARSLIQLDPPLTAGADSLILKSTHSPNRVTPQSYRGDSDGYAPDSQTSSSVSTTDIGKYVTRLVTLSSQPPATDSCPHDVLYISDLISFSSRFCGSNNPSGRKLVFGSSAEMVEVIMELITTTGWGRGFALLFEYRNETQVVTDRDRFLEPLNNGEETLLAVVTGAAFFIVVFIIVICIIFRHRICAKRDISCSSNNRELQSGVQNLAADVSELQLVVSNPSSLEISTDNENISPSPAPTGPTVSSGMGNVSQNAELEVSSSGLSVSESGTDEVFVITAGPGPTELNFSSYKVKKDEPLVESETSQALVSDWLTPHMTSTSPFPEVKIDKETSAPRPRAWSVRTFQDFLPPLPQLQRKWCSWNSTSPFTKLVDNSVSGLDADCHQGRDRKVASDAHLEVKAQKNHSDSSVSNASYPLSQSAQRQRRLNSTSNLKRARFGSPYFGFRTNSSEGTSCQAGQVAPVEVTSKPPNRTISPEGSLMTRDIPAVNSDGASEPVFAISEEDDQQPLVFAEHFGQSSEVSNINGTDQDVYAQSKKDHKSTMGRECHGLVNGSPFNPSTTPDWSMWVKPQHADHEQGDQNLYCNSEIQNSFSVPESVGTFNTETFSLPHAAIQPSAVLGSVSEHV